MPHRFFDAHMHAMNLTHPNFISFVESVSDNLAEFVTSGALSPGYLLTPANRGQHGLITLINMFSVFERPIGEIFALIEEDLSGAFLHKGKVKESKERENRMYPKDPFMRDGKFHFRSLSYDRFALVPLVMDFSRNATDEESKSYYTSEHQEKLISYVHDTLEGIEWYQSIRPEGMLEFFPFLGINPEVHEYDTIEELLHTYVRLDHSPKWQVKSKSKVLRFRGVKFYPPLGTEIWPEDTKKREKVILVYQYCETYGIPIITHCDDQGFRGVAAKKAQQYTNPVAWRPVLERFPQLKVDFAHYGRQYNPLKRSPIKTLIGQPWTVDPWFKEIIDLMQRHDHVYADFSFSGTDPAFYQDLYDFIYQLDEGSLAQKILDRSLFGSDFTVNLAKVESYTNYLRIFEQSPFSDKEIDGFVSANPTRFLGLQE